MTKQRWFKVLLALVVLYAILLGGLWAAMFQPVETFGRVMSRMPVPAVFVVFPFKYMWLIARRGHLREGDRAPNFNLQSLDKQRRVELASFRGSRPVVLVFGSYT
jgi:hypothetical protein